jgi:hypothetical protein
MVRIPGRLSLVVYIIFAAVTQSRADKSAFLSIVASSSLAWNRVLSSSRCSLMVPLPALLTSVADPVGEARQLVGSGMDAFRQYNVAKSIELFDRAEAVFPTLTPYLWQRGLSYYYADRFQDASRQFRIDVQVNPSDTEEIVWDVASQLRMDGSVFPIANQMALPKGTRDSRRIMVRDRIF